MSMTKQKVLAHLEMTRPYTLFYAGLQAMAGAEVSSHGQVAVWRVVLAVLVVLCGWEAGLYAGDYFDRELDAQSKPMRTIPSGHVSPREAWNVMIGLILIGYALALILGIINLLMAVGTTALGIAYSKAFKGQALLGNFDRGLLGMCAVAFGAVASSTITWSLLLPLLLMVLCHDSSTNLVGAMRNREGNGNAGYKTVPVIYGMGRAVDIACALVLMGCVCGAILLVLAAPVPLALIFLLAAILIELLVYISLASTRARVSRLQALWAHKMLVYERLTLLSAFMAIFLPALVVLLIFGSTIAATAIAQKLLCDRYEQSAFGADVKKRTEGALHESTRP